MASVRCDNAECVLYVDELTRAYPQQFELELSERDLSPPRHREELPEAARVVLRRAGPAVLGHPVTRAPRPQESSSVAPLTASAIHGALQLRRAGEAAVALTRWYLARRLQAMVEREQQRRSA